MVEPSSTNAREAFGSYKVDRILGPGAYGLTFLVRDEHGRPYALKWLKENAPPEGRARFENEVWALRKLDHPAIPKFKETGEADGRPYIVMSYAEGDTLRSLVSRNIEETAFVSQQKTLLIMQQVLACLVYLEGLPLHHRDIKDDNVIMSPAGLQVTLIDFGLCEGPQVPRSDYTFWHAGASRFSPPSRLHNPSNANSRQDVFSVAVLAYYLLTNRHPWSVPETEDRGHLIDLMKSTRPARVRDVNQFVDIRISDLIMRMLEIEDYLRIGPSEALAEVTSLLNGADSTATSNRNMKGPLAYSEVMRDPLHGDILLTEYELRLIDTPEFQRLRRIRQLGTSNLVFHGAEHSRFSHAVGTMHTAEKILRRIELRTGRQFESDERFAARSYALLHDISHAPFGHTIEDELGILARHDSNIRRLERTLTERTSSLAVVLQETTHGRLVKEMLMQREPLEGTEWISELTSSPVGADVIDYVDRDSLFCGLEHRVDSAIFRRYAIESVKRSAIDRHVISQLYSRRGFRLDADYAILSLLRERHALFLKVYSHPAKVAAGAMLGKALLIALQTAPSEWTETKIELMGDDELLIRLSEVDHPDVRIIVERLIARKIYKPAFTGQLLGKDELNGGDYDERRRQLRQKGFFEPEWRSSQEREIANRAGIPVGDVVVYITDKAPGAQKVRQNVETKEGNISLRQDSHPAYKSVFTDHLALWVAHVFVPEHIESDKRRLVGTIGQELFQVGNLVDLGHKQLALGLM